MGIEFLHKKKNKFYILDHYTDQTLEFEQLAELPFTSDRKRMSVIVQNRRDEKYYLLTKGADSGMIPNLNIGLQEKNLLEEQLERYACDGLRTLVMGQRELQKSEFDKWDSKF